MTKPLRFALVGCGVIGRAHIDAIENTEGAQLIALCDVAAGTDALKAVSQQHGVALFADLRTMLAAERVDVVDICTPSGDHHGQACLAMNSGCHVIVEKPMAMNVALIDDMVRVRDRTGVKLAVVSQHRFDPAYRHVRELIEAGSFGRLAVGLCEVPWWRSAGYYQSSSWRGTAEFDGGVLMNQAIHSIDLLQWLMGPVDSVSGYAGTLAHDIETEDTAVATMRFASGALGVLSATTCAFPGRATRLEVLGDRGSAIIEEDRLRALHVAGDGEAAGDYGASARAAPGLPLETASDVVGHRAQIADMVRAIRDDDTPFVDGTAGRVPVQIIEAILESSRTGREVRL